MPLGSLFFLSGRLSTVVAGGVFELLISTGNYRRGKKPVKNYYFLDVVWNCYHNDKFKVYF